MYATVGTYYSFYMTVCFPSWIRTTDSPLKRIISTNCCIRTVERPDEKLRYVRNM